MHELALTQEIVDAVRRRVARIEAGDDTRARPARVRRVVLEIGRLAAVMPDAIRFCFDLCAEGTPLEGATLEVIDVPGRARCRACDGPVVLERPFGICACGATDLEWLSGDELAIKEVEVA
jgi:hydrogenase nickel incorporation protein HypA/HybF